MIAPLIGVILGWFLGLLSGPLTEALARRRERNRLKKVLCAELRELVDRSASVVHSILVPRGGDNRELIEWTIAKLELSHDEDALRLVEGLRTLLAFPANQLQAAAQKMASDRAQAGITSSLRTIAVPYLNSQIPKLDLLDASTHEALLQLLTSVRFYNELVGQIPFFLEKSFDQAVTEGNRQRMGENVKRLHVRAAERAKQIADAAERLLRTLSGVTAWHIQADRRLG